MAMPDVVVGVGLLVGIVAVGTVCYVFAREKTLGVGGSVLCLTGLLLIGLSVWKNAEFEVSDSGVTVKVQALEESVEGLKKASDDISTEVERVAKGADTLRTSSEKALTEIRTTVQKQHPAATAGFGPVNLGARIYDAERYRRINQNLATSEQALKRATQTPLKPIRPPGR